jgi:hypothetical protein
METEPETDANGKKSEAGTVHDQRCNILKIPDNKNH